MDLSGNTVLVTGGATGIGRALAEEFAEAGSQVIICGRRKSKLQTAERQLLSLKVKRCDVAVESERRSLLKWTTTHFPGLNVLVNNAGI
ncbi:MAG TPA: SDR family NAD(P)-dependent oxidoreductase, partial [Candidatus Acidoferrales bacterium]|nr:SDR family NAD(P)-dependent oxidoreductase [Candidatus Acidoferrales bacterium]